MRTTNSKERSTIAQHDERIGTRLIKHSNNGKRTRAGETIHKNMETTQNIYF